MEDATYRDGTRLGWRARRKQRALDRRAVRAEFELDRPRGRFAALRAFVAELGELERARLSSHEEAANLGAWRAQPAAKRTRRAPR